MNCHGCKWLDEVKRKGEGYCAKVVQSKTYHYGSRVRLECDSRCELFEEGKFEKRFENERRDNI